MIISTGKDASNDTLGKSFLLYGIVQMLSKKMVWLFYCRMQGWIAQMPSNISLKTD